MLVFGVVVSGSQRFQGLAEEQAFSHVEQANISKWAARPFSQKIVEMWSFVPIMLLAELGVDPIHRPLHRWHPSCNCVGRLPEDQIPVRYDCGQ